MSKFELIKKILELSYSSVWDEAVNEWHFESISIEPKSTCLCSHYPIKELCHIKNDKNGNTTIVGNCCIKKFKGDTTKTKMFNALKRNQLNKALIEYAFEKKIINQWEKDFCIKLWRKRYLSQKQGMIFSKIKEKILNEVLKNAND